jgi:hypothetical protein
MEIERIVTRPDFDGIVCAALLRDVLGGRMPVKWVEPAEIQKGLVEISPGDVIANLPHDPRCSAWFDHHYTNRIDIPFEGAFALAPSAARVIFNHFAGKFSRDFSELVHHTDRIDSAELTEDEVRFPERYPHVLLSMTIKYPETDPAYWERLTDLLRSKAIGPVMEDPVVGRNCRAVVEQNRAYRKLLLEHTEVREKVGITDFRSFEKTPAGNRFLVFSLFPETVVNVKIHFHDRDRKRLVVHLGHSIFNRNCRVNVGLLLSQFGGGGHRGAGAVTFKAEKAGQYIPAIIDALVKNEPNENDSGPP